MLTDRTDTVILSDHELDTLLQNRKSKSSDFQPPACQDVTQCLIMLVDDEPINIKVTQKYLQTFGYTRFVSTVDSTDALRLIQREQPDVLLLDIMMPEVSGFDILEQMQQG